MFRFAFGVFPAQRPDCWRRVVRRSASWGRAGLALVLFWTAGAPVALAVRCPDLALVLALLPALLRLLARGPEKENPVGPADPTGQGKPGVGG